MTEATETSPGEAPPTAGGESKAAATETPATPTPAQGDRQGAAAGEGSAGAGESTPKGAEAQQATSHDYSSVTAPEGIGDEHIDQLRTFAGEHGLTPESAQALAERDKALLDGQVTAANAEFQTLTEGWKQSLASDAEFGGDRLDQTNQRVDAVLTRFDKEGLLRAELERTGFLGHEHLVRFLARVEAAIEPGHVAPGGGTAKSKQSMTERWYSGVKI